MTCAENRERHSALLDGELSPAERALVEAHLDGCPECAAELARLARLVGMLHAIPEGRAAPFFVDRVLAAVRPTPWYARVWRSLTRPRLRLPLEAAAVVIVALGAVYVFQGTPELQQAARQEAPAPSSAPAPTLSTPTPSSTTTPAPVPAKPAPAAPAMSDQRGRAKNATPPPAQESDRARPSAPAPTAGPPSVGPSRDANRVESTVESKMEASERQATAPAAPAEDAAKPMAKESGAKDKQATREAKSSAQKKTDGARIDAPAPPAAPTTQAEPRRQRLGSAAPEAARAFVPPDASGRLSVDDREAAERALVDLRGRLGVTEAFRRDAGEGQVVVEMIVPRAALADFTRGLEGIGRWTWDRDPSTLPPQIRLQILLAR